jgi:two-component system response regulator YesN
MIKVVIVEDEKLLRNEIILTTPWEDLGCEIIGETENGIDGVEIICKLKPDIVITDIRMPGMDGITMTAHLHNKLKPDEMPEIIILTGHSDFEYAKQAIKLGVKDYLLKPVDDAEFQQTIRRSCCALQKRKENNHIKKQLKKLNPVQSGFFKELLIKNNSDTKEHYIYRAIEYIKTNYKSNITISDAAGEIGISGSYLSHIFKERTNYTFLEYLTNYRIKKVLELLKNKELRINEIARETGFSDSSYFSQLFKKYMGITPIDYKNNK